MKIITGIASTTHIDRHNEKMAKSALEGMAKQACTKYIRFLVEHDPNHVIGVILAAKVLPMDDDESALMVVAGIWENKEESKNYEYGAKNTVWKKHIPLLEKISLPIKTQKIKLENSETNKPGNLANLLEIHLNSTEVWPNGSIIKIKRFVASIGDLEIHVYQDHIPPHFHVISKQRRINARFDLKTFELINHKYGQISSKDQKKIKNFFKTDMRALSLLKNEYERFNSVIR